MNPQRRFAPIGGLFKPESVAGLARIRKYASKSHQDGRTASIFPKNQGS